MDININHFDQSVIKKTFRIIDVLQRIGNIRSLREQLCFVGGTALNLIEFSKIERLSIDLDFNYRQVDSSKDWGVERDKIDLILKQILFNLGYLSTDVKINPSYPLTRFHVYYADEMKQDSFKIEIGYLNRVPLFPKDRLCSFLHPKTKEQSKILLPQKEELFGSKLVALLNRKTPRDLFDATKISESKFDEDLLRKSIIFYSLFQNTWKLTNINISEHINQIVLNDSLRMVVRGKKIAQQDFVIYKKKITTFLENIQLSISDSERQCLSKFYKEKNFDLSLFDPSKYFNPKIEQHPIILRTLQTL